MTSENVAAIDCGTNSTRLLIVNGSGERVLEELRLTRLGEAVNKNRQLLPSAIARTCDVLAEFRTLLIEHKVSDLRAVATSAVRDATNAARFLDTASEVLGVRVEMLSGPEEAALTYKGATSKLDSGVWYLVVDIGGGSTEMVLGRDSTHVFAHSFDLGCVRLTEQFLNDDPPTAEQLQVATTVVEREIAQSGLVELVDIYSPDLVAVAGTATSIAALDLGMETFDSDRTDGHRLSLAAIDSIHRKLAAQRARERESKILSEGRADVILGGTIVLLATMRILFLSDCRVSTADLLRGLTDCELENR